MQFFHRFVWIIAGAWILWAVQVGISPFWYDDVCHTLTAACTALHGYECFPERWPLTPETPVQPASGFITTGPLLNYWVALWLWASGFSWYVPRMAMVLLNIGLFAACLRLLQHLEQPKRHQTRLWFWIWLIVPVVQTQVYGSQLIGEVTCGLLLVLGTGLWATEDRKNLGGICLLAACFTKEYAFLVVGIFMLTEYLAERKITPLYWVLSAVLANCGYYALRFGSYESISAYLLERSAYRAEFLAFEWETVGWFLLTKPTGWLGWLAGWVELRVRGLTPPVLALWRMQGILCVFFLAGSGFDRFGWLTLPIGAWFVAAWLAAAWEHAFRKYTQKAAPITVLLLTSLPSLWGIGHLGYKFWTVEDQNKPEKAFARIEHHRILEPQSRIWVADLALLPFIPSRTQIWLPVHAPVYARSHSTTLPDTCTHWVVGPYSLTEYKLVSGYPDSRTYRLERRAPAHGQDSSLNR
jgi:hypothetical protein